MNTSTLAPFQHKTTAQQRATASQRMIAQQTTINSEELVALSRQGDLSAWSELMKRHKGTAYKAALRILKNTEDAEDAVQDAMLRAFRKLSTFRGEATFATWITRISINSALMQLRKKRRHPTLALEDLLGNETSKPVLYLAASCPTPEEHYFDWEARRRLHKAIGQLPTILQGVAKDRIVKELPVEELAVKHGLSNAAAKSRLMRARRMIAHRLAPAARVQPQVCC